MLITVITEKIKNHNHFISIHLDEENFAWIPCFHVSTYTRIMEKEFPCHGYKNVTELKKNGKTKRKKI